IGVKRSQRLLSSVNGFIAVSSKNKKELLEYGIADEERIAVFPNGVDRNIFYPRDKEEARKTLGWSLDKFVVIFVGHFNERKGLLRLDEAVKNLDDVFVAYVGEGKLRPTAKNTLHCGPVEHARLPLLLSAADIFVLPTLHEGCCNAIIEALACGLPVVSSNLDFNKDVLNNDNSLLIDPHKIDEIRAAIIKIKENPALHKLLRNGAIESASRFDLARRTARIVAWMEEKI
ncbi:MAG TPA: glycosyltransferase, partial [Saccharofermentans sp.]|nr:glycosyltransferase [Saccharofermentans sp.]